MKEAGVGTGAMLVTCLPADETNDTVRARTCVFLEWWWWGVCNVSQSATGFIVPVVCPGMIPEFLDGEKKRNNIALIFCRNACREFPEGEQAGKQTRA